MLQFQGCVNHLAFQQAYEELMQHQTIPQTFKHSSISPMPIEMTASLIKLRSSLQQDQQNEILLKAASLEIIRFVSQLSDMYTIHSKDKNKSVNQTLKCDALKLQFSDILSEMRHALTHKAIPDKKLIVSTINYIIDYLKQNYWEIKLKERSPVLQIRQQQKKYLDTIATENDFTFEEYQNYTLIQQEIIFIYCLDYLIGLSDFHIIEKSVEQRLTDRREGKQRISIISKYILLLIAHMLNNKNTSHVKKQLARRQNICNNQKFLILYNKLNIIGFIQSDIKQFIIELEQQLPELKKHKKIQNIDLQQGEENFNEIEMQITKKRQLIGTIYCDYVNNINDQIEYS